MASVRLAVDTDVDALTQIHIAALSPDPIFIYRFPHLKEYPDDHEKYTRARFEQVLPDKSNVVMVYECPTTEDPTVVKPVAFSVWVLPPSQRSRPSSDASAPAKEPQVQYESPDRRDAHPARMAQFRSDMNLAKKEIFEKRYGDKELYLGLLACLPDYQRRGAGQQLLRWGLAKAEAEGLNVTLLTGLTGPGPGFYKKFGFEVLEPFRTQVDGEEEYHDTLAMALEYKQN